jgi:hypothetical protein
MLVATRRTNVSLARIVPFDGFCLCLSALVGVDGASFFLAVHPLIPDMPKRTDISSILIIGAGPIVIGQASEFDYSGTQALKALKAEGYRIVLINSNPATIMTDPELADATYVEPITPEVVERIIAKERPDALLPTMGGQTALNMALTLNRSGVLARYGVEMIGARAEAIDKAEDRQLFRAAMERIGLETPRSRLANASDLKAIERDKYHAERARIEALGLGADDEAHELRQFDLAWAAGEPARRKRYIEKGLLEASKPCRKSACPPSSAPRSRSAAPAAASRITARNSSRSWSAGSTPRPPPRC